MRFFQLSVLRLSRRLGGDIQRRLVYIDLGVDVRPVEILSLWGWS